MAHTFDRYIPLTPNSELANPMDGEDTTAPPSVDFGLELTRQPPVVPVEQGTASLVGAAGPTPPSSASGLKLPPLPRMFSNSSVTSQRFREHCQVANASFALHSINNALPC